MSTGAMRRTRRAFTLVELMIALTGGLIFSIFVFMLTRDVSRFFSQESALSEATAGTLNGFQRLRADVQRAGFLVSPNLAKDPTRCPAPITDSAGKVTNIGNITTASGWATNSLLGQLALARIEVTAGAPDKLTLYGNYTSADQYPVRTLVSNVLHLDPFSDALARSGYLASWGDTDADDFLGRLFPAGSVVRVVSAETGEEQYALVATAEANGGGSAPQISLDNAIQLVTKSAGSSCGVRGIGADLLVNPVQIVRYSIGALPTAYATLGAEDTNWARQELLRELLRPNGTVLSTEVIAEYATNFTVGVQALVNPTTNPVHTYFPPGSADIANYAGVSTQGNTFTTSFFGPHMIRAIRPLLSVRVRAPDRGADAPAGSGYRVPLSTGSGGGSSVSGYARVRTLQALVMTRNARNKQWP